MAGWPFSVAAPTFSPATIEIRQSPIIVGSEHPIVIRALSSLAKCFGALHNDLVARPLRALKNPHHFGNVIRERHSVRVGRLLRPTKFSLHVRRDKFEYLHGSFLQLKSQRLQPGVQKSLRSAVRSIRRERNKSQPRGSSNYSPARLLFKTREERHSQPKHAHNVRLDNGLRHGNIDIVDSKVLALSNPSI